MWGESDRIVAFAGLEALRRLRPDAVVETLPRTGHVPQLERPAAFAAALDALAALPRTDGRDRALARRVRRRGGPPPAAPAGDGERDHGRTATTRRRR